MAEVMTQAITRCPACGMSFRVTESQLRIADGAVRCGACLHVFQAEDFFISPMLDMTERIAIQQEYWAHFDEYLHQVTAHAVPAEPVEPPLVEPVDPVPVAMGPAATGPVTVGTEAVGTETVGTEAVGPAAVGPAAVGPAAVGPAAETLTAGPMAFEPAVPDRPQPVPDDEQADESLPAVESAVRHFEDKASPSTTVDEPVSSDEEPILSGSEHPLPLSAEESAVDPVPIYDVDDLVPVLNEELSPEEVEEAFALYADVGLEPMDTLPPENIGQGDLFESPAVEPDTGVYVPPGPAVSDSQHGFDELAGSPASFSDESDSPPEPADEGLMDFYLDYLDHHPGTTVESPADKPADEEGDVSGEAPVAMGLTIIETRDEPPQALDGLDLDIAEDPDELTAPRRGGVTNAMIGWFAASLGLLGVGLLQYVFFNMDRYAQIEQYRPWYIAACRYVGCDVPEYDRIELLRTRELIVRTHPSEPDALTVDVLLSNNGDFRQLFPGLELTFFDLDGEKTASRVFTVSEYLGGELRGLRFIPARTEVRLSLELVDPGNEALGYEMRVVPL